jgi:chemotaxis signal transduction protein
MVGGFADGIILGVLDSQGRLTPVADLNQRLTVMLKRDVSLTSPKRQHSRRL